MVIVHVVEPFAAGVALFVKSLTEAISDDMHIIIHGERKQVMSANEVKKSFPQNNVRFIRWKSAQRSINPFKDISALAELHNILKKLKQKDLVDAVHLHSSKSGLLGRIACRLAGISSVIYTPNGAPFLSGGNYFTNLIYQQLEKFGNAIGGEVVCCSASEKNEYVKLGIKASFINNGISLTAKTADPRHKIANGKFTIITSGRIEEQKNPALFNKIATYFEEFEDFEFIWAGDGIGKNLLTANNIKVTGWISTEHVKELVAESDIYISTSLYEGLSFGVLEALALRKTVLLSDCVGNTDVIKSGINGDIFRNKKDAILKILNYFNNRDMIDIMGQFSHDICTSDFNLDRNFSSYKKLYQGTSHATIPQLAGS